MKPRVDAPSLADRKGSRHAIQLWEDFTSEFRSKVDRWKPLAHINVVRVLDLNEGLDLKVEYIASGSASQVREVLAGLNYLHSQNPPVVHGCIRMDKLFVDVDGTTKVGEFGLASLLGGFEFFAPSISQVGQIRWMSPELLEANTDQRPAPTMASDVWALGCTLFEIMSGKLPYFRYKHDLRVRHEIISKKSPGLRKSLLDPGLPGVWSLITSCWGWNPEQRPSVHELVQFILLSISLAQDEPNPQESQTTGVGYGDDKGRESIPSLQDRPDELNDLEKDIVSGSGLLALIPDGDPDLPLLLAALGMSHKKRYGYWGELGDLEKAIEYVSRAVALTLDSHPSLPSQLSILGVSYMNRFERLGELADLEKAFEYASRALALTPDGHPDMPGRLSNLGMSYKDRYLRLGDPDDLKKTIEYASHALALTPDGHPDMPGRLSNLGMSYKDRFERLGELADLEKAIECASRALALTPDGHPDMPGRLSNLGVSYNGRFNHLGELADLEKAIEYASRALNLTPDGHPSLPGWFSNLGVSHMNRFERLGEPADLEKATECASRALALTPDGHPDMPGRFSNLGMSHKDRYLHLGDPDDLEKTIEYASHALALTPDSHPDMPGRLSNLGISYNSRFNHLGELADLEKAIEYASRALDLTPSDHSDMPGRLYNLGMSRNDRFNRLGELDDLEKAIEYASRALALTPDGHPDMPGRLSNLGMSHNDRFNRLGEPDDLEKAIKYVSYALSLTPDGHPDMPGRLSDLGISYNDRFNHLGEPDDLEKAIKHQSHALALTPHGHPHLSAILANIGASHDLRFQHRGELSDLERAVEYTSRALDLTPDGHPNSCVLRFNYALLYVRYYEHTSNPSHLQASLNSFRIACNSPAGRPRDRFRHAREWARLASKYSSLDCIEAYQTTIDILPQFIWLGATTNQRYEDLKMVEDLAVDAASAAILSSQHSLALEWLEHARYIIWNQNLVLRSPLDELQASHPILATRIQTVANWLHSASSESKESRVSSSSLITPELAPQERRRLAKEYDELLAEARKLPGFEDFLRPIKANELIHAAQNGPIVVLNCQEDRCDALLVLPGQSVVHLPLPNFTGKQARYIRSRIEILLERRDTRGDDDFGSVLAILWNDIVKPVLDSLGYTAHDSTENLPHLTWCPAGAASCLPLHAAGNYDRPHSRVFDYAISSYTPTLTALLASSRSSLSHNPRILGIGQPNTPGQSPMPSVITELASVKFHAQNKAQYSQLVGDQATTTAVLEAMEHHDWVHLACLSHQNATEPAKSGFFLHDGMLDLAAIDRRSFKNKGLAFLSACQEAERHETLPNEPTSTGSGMLMTGYSSVIASMWSIIDQDAPFVADKVYAQLMKDGKIGNGEAGKALHDAVAELRDKIGVKEFERWVPYIHIGS